MGDPCTSFEQGPWFWRRHPLFGMFACADVPSERGEGMQ